MTSPNQIRLNITNAAIVYHFLNDLQLRPAELRSPNSFRPACCVPIRRRLLLRIGIPVSIGRHLKTIFKKAIDQLNSIASSSGVFRNFKCPYQAIVMNVLEQINKTTVNILDPLWWLQKDRQNRLRFSTISRRNQPLSSPRRVRFNHLRPPQNVAKNQHFSVPCVLNPRQFV
jgi:hypothetical protein